MSTTRKRKQRLTINTSTPSKTSHRVKRQLPTKSNDFAAQTCSSSNVSLYIDSGDCNHICEYCNAFFWFDERTLRTSINHTSGPYVFKIEGQVHHWLGSLCPPPNESPRFLQMYIYDTNNEVSNRFRFFDEKLRSSLTTEHVTTITSILDNCNELVKLFRTAREVCQSTNVNDFTIHLYNNSHNSLCYDKPASGSIGAIVVGDDTTSNEYDIVIRQKNGYPQRINKMHHLYMALQYPLFFMFGESGWSRSLRLQGGEKEQQKNLTMNMFYSHQLHDRYNVNTILLRGGRLFQQYLVDAYVCIEQNRLDYIKMNQNIVRTEVLQGVHDAVERGDIDGRAIGKRTILPSSFTGSPRYMYKHYQDALAICRVHGNPQYFITFTCNVKWPEIERYVGQFPTRKAQDRPDIIARVFQIKITSLINFLKTNKPFGEVAADLYTIEFQKRGLPHCHLLLWVTQSHRISCPQQIDNFISAEIPDPISEPQLYKVVTDLMMHGPCGIARRNSPCMTSGSCKKIFPKKYEPITSFDVKGYVHYKRRSTGNTVIKKGIELDNSYVVPYNKVLSLRYQAHINVEYCGWSMLIKYLFKYISKGADRIRCSIKKAPLSSEDTQGNSTSEIDEIKNFVDGRFICPHEAAWRIFDFQIHSRNPPVQVLSVHLENKQNISFKDSENLQTLVSNNFVKRTTLREWLRNNQFDKNDTCSTSTKPTENLSSQATKKSYKSEALCSTSNAQPTTPLTKQTKRKPYRSEGYTKQEAAKKRPKA